MHKASSITYPKEGPRSALRKMREVGISSILVVDQDRKLLGLITADDASKLLKEEDGDIKNVVKEVPKVHPDANLNELFQFEVFPVAVVDEEDKLKGLVVRGALLAALSE